MVTAARLPLAFVAFAAALLALAGCSSKPAQQEDPGAARMRKVLQAYQLATDIRGRPPRNAEELGRYFKEIGEPGDPDELLRSPRDGQPYVILYGAELKSDVRDVVLAYEKAGADGARYVLTVSREIKLLKDDEFARAAFAKDHKPTPGK